MTYQKALEIIMPMGRYRGLPLKAIPLSYLKWVNENVEFTSGRVQDAVRIIAEYGV